MTTTSNEHAGLRAEDLRTVHVGGYETAVVTRKTLAEVMVSDCRGRDMGSPPKLVFSSNGQGLSLGVRHSEFARAMLHADIIHADGMSVVVASRFTRSPLPERVSTTDFFHDAAEAALKADLSFYFLGGSERQNYQAVEQVRKMYPGLRVAGRRHGYFHPNEEEQICRDICASGADVLWVALGKPLQETWSFNNRDRLPGVGWIKTCGGLFGHLAGDEKRAPRWVQKLGFEWLYRTLQNPKKLGWRYAFTNPHAIWLLIRNTRIG